MKCCAPVLMLSDDGNTSATAPRQVFPKVMYEPSMVLQLVEERIVRDCYVPGKAVIVTDILKIRCGDYREPCYVRVGCGLLVDTDHSLEWARCSVHCDVLPPAANAIGFKAA